jgi:hypothetical protein
MALKIYGVARSRAFRILWMAKELGLDYEHVKVDFATGETRTPAHLALNPNRHVPVIDDDGFVLWESMAINLYLAKKYAAGTLYPTRLEDEARAWQWSFWGMTEVERPVLTALFNRPSLRRTSAMPRRATQPKSNWLNYCGCSMALSGAARTCSGRISPSPTSTSPASSLGPGRPRSTWFPSRRSPSGSRTAPSARPPGLPDNCSGSRGKQCREGG